MWNTTSEGCQFREKPCLFQEILCGSGSNSIHYICIALKKITFKQFFINFWSKIKPCIIVLDFALGLGSRTWILFLLPIQKIKSMLCVQCTRHRREIFYYGFSLFNSLWDPYSRNILCTWLRQTQTFVDVNMCFCFTCGLCSKSFLCKWK